MSIHRRTAAVSAGITARLDALYLAEAERVEAGGLPAQMTQRELAAHLGCTQAYIGIVEADALKKLRARLRSVRCEFLG